MAASGLVVENNRTLPYGEEWVSAAGSANEQKFTSYQRDGESGLDYAIHRFDATTRGVFMSADRGPITLALPQSLNRYIYAMADPVNYTDPSGLSRETPVPPPTLPISWPGWMTLLGSSIESYIELFPIPSFPQTAVLTQNPLPCATINEKYGTTADGRFSPEGAYRRTRIGGPQKHVGVDLGASVGTVVLAAGRGIVTLGRGVRGYGDMIVIDHGNGVLTRYAHLDSFSVDHDAQVAAGNVIGTVGRSGNAPAGARSHLHFEVRLNNARINPAHVFAFTKCD